MSHMVTLSMTGILYDGVLRNLTTGQQKMDPQRQRSVQLQQESLCFHMTKDAIENHRNL